MAEEDEMEHGKSCSCELCSQAGSVRCRLCNNIIGYWSMYEIIGYWSMYEIIGNEDLRNLLCLRCIYNKNDVSEEEIERGV
jgi:hypothetical protein